jgi:hypothetical protein
VDVRAQSEATDSNVWSLRGITSKDRYLQRAEKDRLVVAQ